LLACTEFGLAYGSLDQPVLRRALPLYDTAVLHALAAVEFALEPV
jgi:aspartate/glutamate racemase